MNLSISKLGIETIKLFEGYRSQIYTCPAGYKTIGYGHVVKNYEQFKYLSKPEAEIILTHDLTLTSMAIRRLITIPLKQHQFDMLVSFTFNLGSAALQRSCLRSKINRGEHEAVVKEFIRWIYARGRILPGLVKRRFTESKIYMYGY
jgi:lysozyme